MSIGENENELVEGDPAAQEEEAGVSSKRKLDLEVTISDAGPCKKHISIEVPQAELDRQFQDTLKDFRKEAAMPGFRPGRAPNHLVQKRFRKEVAGQVKSNLLMACLEQLDEDYKLNPITQPHLDIESIEIPDSGPLTFELDVEVQPEFDVPDYKQLHLKRPVRTIGEKDIDAQLKSFLERYAQLIPKLEGGAEVGDFVVADLTFQKDGVTLNSANELQFRFQPELRFQDGRVSDLVSSLSGARPGDTREARAQVGESSPDPALRGQEITLVIHVKDLKQLRLPELDQDFLESIGFESKDELREALKGVLERRVKFQQRQSLRNQLLEKLIGEVPFDLPKDLVARQERTTLRRQIEEMRQNGFTDAQIRAREAEVRADAHAQTLRSLKEYFLLSRIAQAEKIEIDEADFDQEISDIAQRSDESPRRIRARIEKEGLAEGLAQQILERKTLDHMLSTVTIEDEAVHEASETEVETVDQSAANAPEPSAEDGAAAAE